MAIFFGCSNASLGDNSNCFGCSDTSLGDNFFGCSDISSNNANCFGGSDISFIFSFIGWNNGFIVIGYLSIFFGVFFISIFIFFGLKNCTLISLLDSILSKSIIS